jgi:hypothetical protein
LPISPRLSLILAVGIILVASLCQAEPGRLPAGALVLHQALENAAYSLRIKPDGTADYLVWSGGRVREHRSGKLARAKTDNLLLRIKALPKLAERSSGKPGRSDAEWEVDRFVVLTGDGRVAGSLRQSPAAYAELLDTMKRLGAALPAQAASGWYLWAEPVDPADPDAEEEAEPLPFGGPMVLQAQEEALAYPYSPIRIAGPCTAFTTTRPNAAVAAFRLTLLKGGSGLETCPPPSGD